MLDRIEVPGPRTQKEAARQLEEIDRRKDEFLATLSHELRTPLTSGYGWVKLLGHATSFREIGSLRSSR